MCMFSNTIKMRKGDRVYCVLPLYHSSGSKFSTIQHMKKNNSSFILVIVASSVSLYSGATIVLGRRFSVSRFWNDCVDYNVNVFSVSELGFYSVT